MEQTRVGEVPRERIGEVPRERTGEVPRERLGEKARGLLLADMALLIRRSGRIAVFFGGESGRSGTEVIWTSSPKTATVKLEPRAIPTGFAAFCWFV